MAQVHTLTWTNPTTYTDGTALPQSDFAGIQISIDGLPAVSVPVGYATSYDLTQLAVWPILKTGNHTAALAITTKEGVTGAASAAVTFPVFGVPSPATALSVV